MPPNDDLTGLPCQTIPSFGEQEPCPEPVSKRRKLRKNCRLQCGQQAGVASQANLMFDALQAHRHTPVWTDRMFAAPRKFKPLNHPQPSCRPMTPAIAVTWNGYGRGRRRLGGRGLCHSAPPHLRVANCDSEAACLQCAGTLSVCPSAASIRGRRRKMVRCHVSACCSIRHSERSRDGRSLPSGEADEWGSWKGRALTAAPHTHCGVQIP